MNRTHIFAGVVCSISLVAVCAATASAADAVLLKDDFATAGPSARRAIRGDWKFADGVASCAQDDELYKKYKNHGPIIFYDLPFDDATVTFAFKAEKAKAVTFTANGKDGHIFRVSWGARGTNVRAFPPGSKEKSVGVGQDEQPLQQGVWIPVQVTLEGSKATVKVGDNAPQVFQHESFAGPKTNVSVGFSFGSVSVREFAVSRCLHDAGDAVR